MSCVEKSLVIEIILINLLRSEAKDFLRLIFFSRKSIFCDAHRYLKTD